MKNKTKLGLVGIVLGGGLGLGGCTEAGNMFARDLAATMVVTAAQESIKKEINPNAYPQENRENEKEVYIDSATKEEADKWLTEGQKRFRNKVDEERKINDNQQEYWAELFTYNAKIDLDRSGWYSKNELFGRGGPFKFDEDFYYAFATNYSIGTPYVIEFYSPKSKLIGKEEGLTKKISQLREDRVFEPGHGKYFRELFGDGEYKFVLKIKDRTIIENFRIEGISKEEEKPKTESEDKRGEKSIKENQEHKGPIEI